MFKQLFLPIIAVAVFIALVGLFIKNPGSLGVKVNPTISPQATKQQIFIENTKIDAIVASTAETRTKGLSGYTSLKENEGMIFVFDTKDVTPIFWMKDMLIPIDIIWIDDNKIVKIDKNLKAPTKGTPDNKLQLYKPGVKVDYVLEVNAGFSEKNNFKIGSETKFDL